MLFHDFAKFVSVSLINFQKSTAKVERGIGGSKLWIIRLIIQNPLADIKGKYMPFTFKLNCAQVFISFHIQLIKW